MSPLIVVESFGNMTTNNNTLASLSTSDNNFIIIVASGQRGKSIQINRGKIYFAPFLHHYFIFVSTSLYVQLSFSVVTKCVNCQKAFNLH